MKRNLIDGVTLIGIGLTVVALRGSSRGSPNIYIFWGMVVIGLFFMVLGNIEIWFRLPEK